MIEVRARLRHLRMSPKKVRLVADTIKGLDVQQALARLRFTQKAASPVLSKLLQSAIANASHNNNIPAESLMIKNVIVNQAPALKRWKPAAFGSPHPFKKHGSHIDLTLGLKSGVAEPKDSKAKKIKKEAKPVAKAIKSPAAEIATKKTTKKTSAKK